MKRNSGKRRRKKAYFRRWIPIWTCGCVLAFFLGHGTVHKQQAKEEPGMTIAALPVYAEEEERDGKKTDKQGLTRDERITALREERNAKEENGSRDPETEEKDSLILVNCSHPLPEDYSVELTTLEDGVHQGATIAYDSLCEMLRAGIREGLTFEICSAYRSVKRQKELFDEDLNDLLNRGWAYEDAWDEVARETMPPGCSEHATGLAFDIVSFDYQLLDKKQKYTRENIWLREHCAEYGFILRYPEDKEDITGIRYESWHFRYVGEAAAKEITERGITLEEYVEQNAAEKEKDVGF